MANRDRGPADYIVGRIYKTVSSLPSIQAMPETDVIYPEVLLYIEGVQVPFSAISISTSYRGMPEANIQVPYFQGLQNICKGYFPKVHIFFKDEVCEKWFLTERGLAPEHLELKDKKEYRRVLFSGVIIGSQYNKQKSTNSAEMSISFRCIHKYYALREIIMKFGARGLEQITENEAGTVAGIVDMNSTQAMLSVIGGITQPAEGDDPVGPEPLSKTGNIGHVQPELREYAPRLRGIPGIALAIWNLIKRDTYRFEKHARIMTDIYVPLVDSGLRVFRRMSGHPIVEAGVDANKIEATASYLSTKAKSYQLKGTDGIGNSKIIVPPSMQNFIGDAAAIDFSLLMTQVGLQYTGEMSDMWSFISGLMTSLKYDVEILTSPVQPAEKDKEPIDLILKPLLPFYYSPVCNVLLPNLYTSLSFSDLPYQVPTRVTMLGSLLSSVADTKKELEYRAPHEIRDAIAQFSPSSNGQLGSTRMSIGEYPAVHEYARGVKLKRIQADRWINFLMSGYDSDKERGDFLVNIDSNGTATRYTDDGLGPTARELRNRLIDPELSDLEDLANQTRVWKYWPTNKKIPWYNLDVTKDGFSMEWGKAGPAVADAAGKISSLRQNTGVPKYWNVVWFRENDTYAVFPPHYDYVRNQWWATEPMYKAKNFNQVYNYKNLPSVEEAEAATAAKKAGKEETSSTADKNPPSKDSLATLTKLKEAWDADYPNSSSLNPYELESVNGIQPYEVTLYSLIDYEYALALVETRTGSVEGPFNPYIIPGYPMDIIEPSTEAPSVHAFCVSVSHSITSQSINTSISFTSGMTYDEMRAYELPAILPWFRDKFLMLEKLSLMDQTPEAKAAATEYYMGLLGVGFADPTILEDADSGAANSVYVDFQTGNLELDTKDIFLSKDALPDSVSSKLLSISNPNLTYQGSLNLIRREIESMADIEQFSGITFVDIQDRTSLSPHEKITISPVFQKEVLKPGRSMFIDYSAEEKIIEDARKKNSSEAPPARTDVSTKDTK